MPSQLASTCATPIACSLQQRRFRIKWGAKNRIAKSKAQSWSEQRRFRGTTSPEHPPKITKRSKAPDLAHGKQTNKNSLHVCVCVRASRVNLPQPHSPHSVEKSKVQAGTPRACQTGSPWRAPSIIQQLVVQTSHPSGTC